MTGGYIMSIAFSVGVVFGFVIGLIYIERERHTIRIYMIRVDASGLEKRSLRVRGCHYDKPMLRLLTLLSV